MSISVLQTPPEPPGPRPRTRAIAIVITVLAAAGGVGTAVLLRSGVQPLSQAQPQAQPPGVGATGQPSAGPSSPAQTQPSAQPSTEPSASTQPPAGTSGLPLLWPFARVADAAAWQRSYRSGGHQPWHLDAGQTALSFTQGYLGYAEIDKVLRVSPAGAEAWVTVGWTDPNGAQSAAADVHLARIGTGADAPWEVVGTRDTTVTLTQPAYGATVGSPLLVGGRITGVDESLSVQVRALGKPVLGQVRGIPAGGERTPWSARVGFTGAAPGTVLTVAVSVGGGLRATERFAVTAVRAGSGAARDGDVDGDGKVDTVGFAGTGLLRVRYATGRVETVRFAVPAQPYSPRLVGVVDADRQDGRAEVFVTTMSGASTDFSTVFRYVGRHLRVVTMPGGGQSQLGSGGSARHQDSWACQPPRSPIVTWSGQSTDAERFPGTVRRYRFDGARLVLLGSQPYTVTADHPAPRGCGSIR